MELFLIILNTWQCYDFISYSSEKTGIMRTILCKSFS